MMANPGHPDSWNPELFPCAKYWYNKDGKLHREDGPAIEYKDGSKSWLLNGVYHREDGPAMEFANGDKSWFLNGKSLTESEWKNNYFLASAGVRAILEDALDERKTDVILEPKNEEKL